MNGWSLRKNKSSFGKKQNKEEEKRKKQNNKITRNFNNSML